MQKNMIRDNIFDKQLPRGVNLNLTLFYSVNVSFLNSGLDQLQQESIASEASNLKQNAIQSRDIAGEAIQSITNVEDQLPDATARARQLMKNVADGNKAIQLAHRQGILIWQGGRI